MTPHRFLPIVLPFLVLTGGCGTTVEDISTNAAPHETWQSFAETRRATREARDAQPTPLFASRASESTVTPIASTTPSEPVVATQVNSVGSSDQLEDQTEPTANTNNQSLDETALDETALIRLPPVEPPLERLPVVDATATAIPKVAAELIPAPFFAHSKSGGRPSYSTTLTSSTLTSSTLANADLFELTPPQTTTHNRTTEAPAQPQLAAVSVAEKRTNMVDVSADVQATFGAAFNWSALQDEQELTKEDRIADIPAEMLRSLKLSPEMAQRAEEMMAHATRLAERGALYSARTEFLRVMRLVAQSLDSELGYRYHTRALSLALQALDEADDFAARGTSVDSDLQVAGFVAGHRTPVLKNRNIEEYTPLMAMQAYYAFAMQHLQLAGNREPVASRALYGLGKIDIVMSQAQGKGSHGGPTPVALFRSALAIDQRNADAANELGVLMARCGQLEEATKYLEQSLAVRSTPAVAGNLAEVRRRRGAGGSMMPQPMPGDQELLANAMSQRVQWVDPAAFARGGEQFEPTPAQRPTVATPPADEGRWNPLAGFAAPTTREGDASATTAKDSTGWFSR